MTPKTNHKQIDAEGQATIQELLQEKLRLAIKLTIIQTLEEEVEAFVKAEPYQRTAERRDYRNGTYPRDLGTSMGVIEELPVPRTRKGFRSEIFERYKRRQAELDKSICEMFVQGVSTEKVGGIVETLSGSHPVHPRYRGFSIPWKRSSLAGKSESLQIPPSVRNRRWNLFQRDL